MRKGVIVLVPFPFTDLSGQKVRPALILYASRNGENCIVAFITSADGKKIYPFDISVSASRQNGLKHNSLIKLDCLATLQKTIILGELGKLELSRLGQVTKKLRFLFGL